MHVILGLILAWLGLGLLGSGFTFAQEQDDSGSRAKRWREDLGCALLFGIAAGPFALLVSFMMSGFGKYGWRLWPKGRK